MWTTSACHYTGNTVVHKIQNLGFFIFLLILIFYFPVYQLCLCTPIRKWYVTNTSAAACSVVYISTSFVIMPRFQMYGHQRQGSDSAAFKELSKRDAQTQLIVELEKLLKTCPEGNREVIHHNPL